MPVKSVYTTCNSIQKYNWLYKIVLLLLFYHEYFFITNGIQHMELYFTHNTYLSTNNTFTENEGWSTNIKDYLWHSILPCSYLWKMFLRLTLKKYLSSKLKTPWTLAVDLWLSDQVCQNNFKIYTLIKLITYIGKQITKLNSQKCYERSHKIKSHVTIITDVNSIIKLYLTIMWWKNIKMNVTVKSYLNWEHYYPKCVNGKMVWNPKLM